MKLLRTSALLATACIGATALSCALPASAATPNYDVSNSFTRLVLHDTLPNAAGEYIAIHADLTGQRVETLAEAEKIAGGDFFDIPHLGTEGNPVSGVTPELTYDLKVDPQLKNGIAYDRDGGSIGDDNHLFDVSEEGTVESEAGGYLAFSDADRHLSIDSSGRYELAGSSRGEGPTALEASVVSYDETTGTARIMGSASSSAFYDARITYGQSFATTDPIGHFIMDYSGIPAGAKSIELEQEIDGEPFDKVEVQLTDDTDPVVPLTPATIDNKTVTAGVSNHFTGTATKGASIRILNNSGTQIVPGTITANATTGAFVFDRVVSKGAASFAFKIEQAKDGKTLTSNLITLKADAAADLTPATIDNKTVTAGVSNHFTGTATKGATIRILNNSGTQIVPGTITANATTGAFEFDRVVSKGAASFAFKIEQAKDGKTLTSNLITLKADAAADLTPATIDNKTVTAGVSNHFTGTATKGATIRILNNSGTQIVPGTITANATTGAFEFDRVVSKGAASFAFKIEQTKDGKTLTSNLITLTAS